MAKMKWEGVDEWVVTLVKMDSHTDEMIEDAIYAGANMMADAVRAEIERIPIDNRKIGKGTTQLEGIRLPQREGLLEGFGIAPIQRESGFTNVKLGFDGYNSVVTDKYPNGQPNSLIARSVNAGTTFRRPYPFMDRIVREYKDRVEKAIKKKLEDALITINKL